MRKKSTRQKANEAPLWIFYKGMAIIFNKPFFQLKRELNQVR